MSSEQEPQVIDLISSDEEEIQPSRYVHKQNGIKSSTTSSKPVDELENANTNKRILNNKNGAIEHHSTKTQEDTACPMSRIRRKAEEFLERCVLCVNADEGTKIQQKMWKHFENCQEQHLLSSEFQMKLDMSANATISSENVFLLLKDLIDDLKHWKKRRQENNTVVNEIDGQNTNEIQECLPTSSSHVPNLAHIRKLEKLLDALHKKIQKLKENEVDLDDDQSAYVLEEKFQKRLMKVWNKLCELKGCSKKVGRQTERKYRYQGTRYPELNQHVQNFINKTKAFPDYCDILKIVKDANTLHMYYMDSEKEKSLAREIFSDVGKDLQKRRQLDEYDLAGCPLTDTEDWRNGNPEDNDTELKQKLLENEKEHKHRIQKVLDDYAKKQVEIKEEPEDVPEETVYKLQPDVNEEHESSESSSSESEHDEATEEIPAAIDDDSNSYEQVFEDIMDIEDSSENDSDSDDQDTDSVHDEDNRTKRRRVE